MNRRDALAVACVFCLLPVASEAQSLGSPDQPASVIDRPRIQWKAHKHSLNCVAISPDGRTLASSSVDEAEIKLWSLPEAKLLARLKGHRKPAWVLAFAPDGKTLASGSWDKTIKLWSLPEGRLLATLAGHT